MQGAQFKFMILTFSSDIRRPIQRELYNIDMTRHGQYRKLSDRCELAFTLACISNRSLEILIYSFPEAICEAVPPLSNLALTLALLYNRRLTILICLPFPPLTLTSAMLSNKRLTWLIGYRRKLVEHESSGFTIWRKPWLWK